MQITGAGLLMWQDIREDFDIHGRSFTNGGFWAMVVYRYGVWSLNRRFKPWRWFTGKIYGILKIVIEITTGVLLDRTTKIGKGFHIIHTGMVSIHPHSIIGDRVGIMHNVTLGTNMGSEAPVIGNDVFIGCGASILGGVKIGDGARIGANSLVITDVPAGAVAIGVPAKVMPDLIKLRQKAAEKKPEPPAGDNQPIRATPAAVEDKPHV
jgi:serine O-acetyltransferase